MSGAIVLMISNAVSKILGAVFKIPLTYIVHEEGMAIYNTAFTVYIMFLSIIISGMPFAVQKLTAGAYALGDSKRAVRIVALSTYVLAGVGIIGSAAMWFGAEFLALAMKEERAVWAIRAVAPSVFFVACGTAVKSGFQGNSDMIPTAVSQVIEALIKLCAGYLLAYAFISYGTQISAAGAVFGVTLGELTATVILIVWYVLSKRSGEKCRYGDRKILRDVFNIALPMLLMSAVTSSISVCDTSLLRMSLLNAGMSQDEARFVYGAYSGYAQTVLNLPIGLLSAISVSVIPIISGAAALENGERIKSVTQRALTVSASAGVFFFICLYYFSDEILYILFKNTYSSNMLKAGSLSVIFICMMQIGAAVLQSVGRIDRSFISMLTAMILKAVFTIVFASRPEFNIYGAILGSTVGFFVGMIMNLIFISIHTGLKREYIGIILKPILSGAAAYMTLKCMERYILIDNIIIHTFVMGAISFVVFALCLYSIGGLRIKDE